MEQATINIKGMTCEHCKSAVRTALLELEGVSAVEVHLEDGHADVTFDSNKVLTSKLKEAVEEQGYDVV
ncbi:copper chaperone CopZ [Pseudalkalibacillus hwajinpoensis]|uniref:Copper chaperone CopZ n=1 Tax=Guptibacillus hwajinpoensis TaxID=208199 RepID=A0A4U1MHR6_9BACL|nr:copper chaperone CopZ [Pseudalkalibacillus hwajinpoensis]TKD70024.1 copper chaperone CopZ [Pseudalkalibacillus hwajinpoensis]